MPDNRDHRTDEPATERKVSHIGAPACFALEMACKQVQDAFAPDDNRRLGQVYIVGSSLQRADWRDVDVRMILDDASFAEMFPSAVTQGAATWEFDPRWTLMCTAISQWMSKLTGLPIDFQFQQMTWANKQHNKTRHAAGLRFAKSEASDGLSPIDIMRKGLPNEQIPAPSEQWIRRHCQVYLDVNKFKW